MLLLIILSTYSFTVVTPDTIQYINPQEEAIFDFELYNTGTDDDVYELNLKSVDFPDSWGVLFCYSQQCLVSGLPYRVYDSVPSGEADTNIAIHVLTDDLDTTGTMEFTITSQGDITLMEKYNLYVITSSGISEYENDIQEDILIVTGIKSLKGEVFDVNGREVYNPETGIYFLIDENKKCRKVVVIR